MHGCVVGPCVSGVDEQFLLDIAFWDFDPDQIINKYFDVKSVQNSFWEALKDEEDTSPSSTSHSIGDINTTTEAGFDASTDETIISSSTKLCDEKPPSPSSTLPTAVKQKATVDSPPDDVKAFFGHPLTRATSALNGAEFDINANAEALLHEYNNLPAIDREDLKESEKISGFLSIISAQRSNPTLSRTGAETLSSPPAVDSNSIDADIIQDGVDMYEEELVGDTIQQGASVITEYSGLFQPDFQLEVIAGQSEGHADSSRNVGSNRTVVRRSSERPLRTVKPRKADRKLASNTREPTNEGKRAARKSRSKSDLVTSTTNGPAKHTTSPAVTTDLPESTGPSFLDANTSSRNTRQFQHKANGLIEAVGSPVTVICSTELPQDGSRITSISPDSHTLIPGKVTVVLDERIEDQLLLPVSQTQQAQAFTTSITHSTTSSTSSSSSPILPQITAASGSSHPANSSVTTVVRNVSQIASLESQIKEHSLKKALSDKIRSRQSTEDIMSAISASYINFLHEDGSGVELVSKFSGMATVKQEDPYMESYDQHYSYDSHFQNTVTSLVNLTSLDMNSFGAQNVSMTMEACNDIISEHDPSNNGLNEIVHASINSIHNGSVDPSHLHESHLYHHHQQQHQQQQDLITEINSRQMEDDGMIVHSSQGRCFQILQPLQPEELHSHVTSTIPNTGSDASSYYGNVYCEGPNAKLCEVYKHPVAYQHRQCNYGNGYNQIFNHETNNNIKSPDSGYQEPCLSPSCSAVVLKDIVGSAASEEVREKTKKKRKTSLDAETGCGTITKQCSSSGSDKSAPRSPVIKKLDANTTGYIYFLEAPISTTQRKDQDRVTYLNKSQYYSLMLQFSTQERELKCSSVKSVIVLAFREEKTLDEEKKAWEFWHGRQHSYKQRILDVDTKNCHGVTPQNIEEVAFNAVAIKWSPMDGPVRVNMAVHCLSTDFSNQKGVKGIPLHIQIDTYEQSSKGSHLVHRGYCQIKAFCDKGAERKTRDEERRKVAKGKSDEFSGISHNTKSRRKTEESFHDPCEKSEFYSMADITTAPVFFNPLHENTEFIHRSLSIGVLPSQDEEISSIPSGLELPDSCDDYYTNNPAKRSRRDSCSNPKDQPKVLLYVREHHETVYTALMLEVPTLQGLLKSIEQKYCIAPFKVKNVYKKSRKGILVKLDDNIVRHYSHEATFIIETNKLNESGDYEIIFIEFDASSS